MGMSRRHFRKLAAAINETFEEMENGQHTPFKHSAKIGVEVLMSKIMKVCRSENPNFDSGRFHAACQPEVVEA